VIEMCERQPELAAAGVVAVSWMSYFDSPGSGGYFADAESYKGLRYADDQPKPAWHVYKECVLHGASWKATGATPPGAPPEEVAAGCSCRSSQTTQVPVWPLLAVLLALSRRGLARR
jgi:MYXO-CTERM domain-containing protein